MPLPDTVRVKLSSEAAEYVSITPVVVREMPTRELVEHMLGVTGKNETRVRDLLLRGTLVSGASRFRWSGWNAESEWVRSLLATFPDPDPLRPFDARQCMLTVLRGSRHPIGIPRDIGSRRGLPARILGRPSFWDLLMQIAGAGQPRYTDYSYRERADVYQLGLAAPEARLVREASSRVCYTALEAQIRQAWIEALELYVVRS